MKILFINPPSYINSFYRNEYPPLGIGYLASACINSGHDVDILDLGVVDYSFGDIIEYVTNYNPDYCSFTLYTVNLLNTYRLINAVRSSCECKIIVGGPHATILPDLTLNECPAIDYLIKGEGESTLLELLSCTQIHSIQGLYYYDCGNVIHNQPRKLIEDLNSISFPNRTLFEKYDYSYDELRITKPVAPMIAGRGCPYNCSFCASKALWGTSFRMRPVKNVIAEIEQIIESGTTEFYFEDDLFTFKSDWVKQFCETILNKNIKITWKALSRADTVTLNNLKLMKLAGCHTIQFGVESGSDKILRSINKKVDKATIQTAFKLAHQAGLNTHAFFMFGHEHDTESTINETLDFAKELNSDFISFFVLVPFPGTYNYDILLEPTKYDWSRFAYYHDNVKPLSICHVTPDQLLEYESNAYRNYFLRFGYFKNMVSGRSLLNVKVKFVLVKVIELFPPVVKSCVKKVWGMFN